MTENGGLFSREQCKLLSYDGNSDGIVDTI